MTRTQKELCQLNEDHGRSLQELHFIANLPGKATYAINYVAYSIDPQGFDPKKKKHRHYQRHHSALNYRGRPVNQKRDAHGQPTKSHALERRCSQFYTGWDWFDSILQPLGKADSLTKDLLALLRYRIVQSKKLPALLPVDQPESPSKALVLVSKANTLPACIPKATACVALAVLDDHKDADADDVQDAILPQRLAGGSIGGPPHSSFPRRVWKVLAIAGLFLGGLALFHQVTHQDSATVNVPNVLLLPPTELDSMLGSLPPNETEVKPVKTEALGLPLLIGSDIADDPVPLP